MSTRVEEVHTQEQRHREPHRHGGVQHLGLFFPVYTPSYTGAKFSFHLAPFEETKALKLLTVIP